MEAFQLMQEIEAFKPKPETIVESFLQGEASMQLRDQGMGQWPYPWHQFATQPRG
jgi:hypothetical protein